MVISRFAPVWLALLLVAAVVLAQTDSDGDGISDDVDPYPQDAANIPSDRNSTIWRVAEVYVATLNRAVDAEGLYYWVNEVETRSEWEPLTVAQSFFDQPEVQSEYPASLGYGGLIEKLYVNVLGREVDPEGYNYWLSELTSERLRPNQMIIALINGLWANPEAYQNGDVARFRNLVKVSLAFADEQRDKGFRLSQASQAKKAQFLSLAADLFNDVDSSSSNTEILVQDIDVAFLLEFGGESLFLVIGGQLGSNIVEINPSNGAIIVSRGVTGGSLSGGLSDAVVAGSAGLVGYEYFTSNLVSIDSGSFSVTDSKYTGRSLIQYLIFVDNTLFGVTRFDDVYEIDLDTGFGTSLLNDLPFVTSAFTGSKQGLIYVVSRKTLLSLTPDDWTIVEETPLLGMDTTVADCAFVSSDLICISGDGFLTKIDPNTGETNSEYALVDFNEVGPAGVNIIGLFSD